MKVSIFVLCKYGKYVSKQIEMSEKEFDQTKSLIEKINDLNFLNIDTEFGKVYFPANVIKDSVITLIVEQSA